LSKYERQFSIKENGDCGLDEKRF